MIFHLSAYFIWRSSASYWHGTVSRGGVLALSSPAGSSFLIRLLDSVGPCGATPSRPPGKFPRSKGFPSPSPSVVHLALSFWPSCSARRFSASGPLGSSGRSCRLASARFMWLLGSSGAVGFGLPPTAFRLHRPHGSFLSGPPVRRGYWTLLILWVIYYNLALAASAHFLWLLGRSVPSASACHSLSFGCPAVMPPSALRCLRPFGHSSLAVAGYHYRMPFRGGVFPPR